MAANRATDIGALTKTLYCSSSNNAGAPSLITANAGLDNLKVDGDGIDKTGYLSGVVQVVGLAALADAETVTLTVEREESDDDSVWVNPTEVQAATVVATSSGGTNENFVLEVDQNLKPLKKFVRYNVTLDLSAGATDTAIFDCALLMGGADVAPAL